MTPALHEQVKAVRRAAEAAPQDAALAAAVRTLGWLGVFQPSLTHELAHGNDGLGDRDDLERLCRAMEGLMP